jgi:predicted Zn-dependent protease
MRRFRVLFLVLLVTTGVTVFWYRDKLARFPIQKLWHFSYCDQAITYSVDEIDERFDLSRPRVLQAASQAAQIWNQAIGKTLFIPAASPEATLSVNFVYDGRQGISDQISAKESQVELNQTSLAAARAAHQKKLAEFTQRAASFKQKVAAINAAGGAQPAEYDQLVAEQQQLQTEATQLNAQSSKLNMSFGQFNNQVTALNQTIALFNQSLDEKPEEGIYNPNSDRIEVYLNKDPNQLVHTLAHEFGHALGLGHNDDKTSIMYRVSSWSLKPSRSDLSSLKEICQEYSGWPATQLRIQQLRSGKNVIRKS